MKMFVLIAILSLAPAAATLAVMQPPADAATPAPAVQPAADGATAPADPKAIARGRTVFLENCIACHGQDATGGSDANTDLTRSLVVKNDVAGRQFGEFLENGRPDQRMPPFVLEADKVKDLAVYLHSISVLKPEAPDGSQKP